MTETAAATTTKRKADDEETPVAKKTKTDEAAVEAAPAAEGDEEIKQVFVGRLSWNVDNDWLASEFAECGEVVSARVVMDRESGKSRG